MSNILDNSTGRALLLWLCSFSMVAVPCYFFVRVPLIALITAALVTLIITLVRSRRAS